MENNDKHCDVKPVPDNSERLTFMQEWLVRLNATSYDIATINERSVRPAGGGKTVVKSDLKGKDADPKDPLTWISGDAYSNSLLPPNLDDKCNYLTQADYLLLLNLLQKRVKEEGLRDVIKDIMGSLAGSFAKRLRETSASDIKVEFPLTVYDDCGTSGHHKYCAIALLSAGDQEPSVSVSGPDPDLWPNSL